MTFFAHRKAPASILTQGKVLDIGCGTHKTPGALGLDSRAAPGVDIIADLEKPLPLDSDSFDVVFANQVIEHVRNLPSLVQEVHRVLKPGGQFLAHVPYFRSSWAHCDATHVRFFSIQGLDHFVAGTLARESNPLSEAAFSKCEVFLDSDYPSTLMRRIFTSLALRNPVRFENSALSFLFPFEQLTFLLTK
jgi:SAM-dependent methyltransferase